MGTTSRGGGCSSHTEVQSEEAAFFAAALLQQFSTGLLQKLQRKHTCDMVCTCALVLGISRVAEPVEQVVAAAGWFNNVVYAVLAVL